MLCASRDILRCEGPPVNWVLAMVYDFTAVAVLMALTCVTVLISNKRAAQHEVRQYRDDINYLNGSK